MNLADQPDRREEKNIGDVLSDESGSCVFGVEPDQPKTTVLMTPICGDLGNVHGRSSLLSGVVDNYEGLMPSLLQIFQFEA